MTNTAKIRDNNGKQQAGAQLSSVRGMVAALRIAQHRQDSDKEDEAREVIQNDALSVDVKTGWQSLGDKPQFEEYRILLCTGGPAVQIIGDLDQYGQPYTAKLQYQDWFTPWTELEVRDKDEQALLEYSQVFYWGE